VTWFGAIKVEHCAEFDRPALLASLTGAARGVGIRRGNNTALVLDIHVRHEVPIHKREVIVVERDLRRKAEQR